MASAVNDQPSGTALDLKDFLERLGRSVEISGNTLVARTRTALIEEEMKFRVLDSDSDKPLKARGTTNIVGPSGPSIDREEYPKTYFFSEFLDRTIQADRISEDLLADPRVCSQAAEFIPQNLMVRGESLSETSLEYFFSTWLPDPHQRLLAVLAPAGFGKTVLTCAIANRLAENYRAAAGGPAPPPFPYLINFGDYRRLSSFEAMILTSLERKGVTDYHSNAFAYLVAQRRVVLILDGFDELLDERPEEARKNLRELIETLEGKGKVVVTARSTFFRTSDDVANFLEYDLEGPEVSVVDLQPFNSRQRDQLVTRLTDHDRSKYNRVSRFLSADVLQEPMGSPLLLKETVEALLQDGEGRLDAAGGRRDLFASLERSVYERERVRKNHTFSDDAQRAFLDGLAKEMLEGNVREFDWESVQVVAHEAAADADHPAEQAELDRFADHHFLHVADGSQAVRFNHQVFREYFQARAMLDVAASGGKSWVTAILSKRPLPEEVADFLGEIDSGGQVADQLLLVVEDQSHPSERLTQNLAAAVAAYKDPALVTRLIDLLPAESPLDLQVEGLELKGSDWSGRFAYTLSFADSGLDEANFSGASIAELSLLNTSVEGADFRDASVETLVLGYGDRLFGNTDCLRRLAELGAITGVEGDQTDESWEKQRRRELVAIVRSRLKRFYVAGSGPDGKGSRWDSSIKEMNLMGGVDPAQRRFVKGRVIPAMCTENVLNHRRAYGEDIFDLMNDAEDDARELLENDRLVGSVAAVIDRLQSRE